MVLMIGPCPLDWPSQPCSINSRCFWAIVRQRLDHLLPACPHQRSRESISRSATALKRLPLPLGIH